MKLGRTRRRAKRAGRVAIPAIPCLLAALIAVCLLLYTANGDPAQAGAPPSSSPPWALRGELRGGPLPTPTPTTVPFLYPPFAGGYRITSYVDHLSPDYGWDDTVVIYSGEQAHAIDGIWKRTRNCSLSA